MLQDVPRRAARPDRQHRRRRGRAAAAGGALRRGRPLPGRRRRQGHGDVLRHRQRGVGAIRLLARRRVRLGRLAGLRPQGDGDHRARRVGVGQAPLPRAGDRHPDHRLHGRRDRRHVRRRVRQRDAALAAHQAARGVQPPARVPRSDPGSRDELRRAQAAVRAAPLVVERLRPVADLAGRRRVRAHRQVDRDLRGGTRGARHRGGRARAQRADPRDPRGARRPALERRHRHLREGDRRDPRRCRRQGQRRAPASTARSCAAASSAKAATSASPSAAGSSTPARAGATAWRDQHRRDRQRRRGQLLRPRGQHQDPARRVDRERRHDREAAQRAARRDDRRGRRGGPVRQLYADAGAQPRARAGGADDRRARSA